MIRSLVPGNSERPATERAWVPTLAGAMTDTDELRIDRQDGCAYTLEAFIDPWNLR